MVRAPVEAAQASDRPVVARCARLLALAVLTATVQAGYGQTTGRATATAHPDDSRVTGQTGTAQTTPAATRAAPRRDDADALMQFLQSPVGSAQAAEAAPGPGNSAAAPSQPGLLANAKDRATDVLVDALSYIGIRYKYGGNTPDHGFDCSGLVRWVYNRTWGLMLPRRAEQIAKIGVEVPRDELQPGDLVFFNTLRRTFSHVGIYLGDGQFLHAPSTGGKVRIENLDQAYWQKRWNGARRLSDAELATGNTTAASPQPSIETSAARQPAIR